MNADIVELILMVGFFIMLLTVVMGAGNIMRLLKTRDELFKARVHFGTCTTWRRVGMIAVPLTAGPYVWIMTRTPEAAIAADPALAERLELYGLATIFCGALFLIGLVGERYLPARIRDLERREKD
ncbi:MAG: hypothetical protein ACTSRY_02960 [Alphaproteobacteria bacterium]